MSKFYEHIMSESRLISEIVSKHDDHISGLHLFAACNSRNLQLKPIKFQCKTTGDKRTFSPKSEQAAESYQEKFFLPVLFHNGKTTMHILF